MTITEIETEDDLFVQASQRLVDMVSEFDAKCLVLLSGGSAVKSYLPLVEYIASGQATNLMIGLADERYGPVGHEQSNARQIGEQTSLWSACEAAGVEYRLPLQGFSLEQSMLDYDTWLHHALAMCPIRIVVLGMGIDGHTAGMFPMSLDQFDELFIKNEDQFYMGYSSKTEFDLRLTLRIPLLQQMTRVLLVAAGKDKRTVFDQAMNIDAEQEETCLPVSCLRYVADATAMVNA